MNTKHERRGREIMLDFMAMAETQLSGKWLGAYNGQLRATAKEADDWRNLECQCVRLGLKCKEIEQ